MKARHLCFLLALAGTPAAAQDIDWGDDSADWANDGECDDRRFFGEGMAAGVSWEWVGRDASDCRTLYEQGRVQIWSFGRALAATDCSAINFGDDSSDFANNNVCDDFRFEGLATDRVMRSDEVLGDATDCQRLCNLGVVFLRNY